MTKASTNHKRKETQLPISVDELHDLIITQQHKLSARLKIVASWLLEHPQQVALRTLAEIATDAGVHASTLVRFANHFGFDGFSELQKLYKDQIIDHHSNYRERIHQLKRAHGTSLTDNPSHLLAEFTEGHLLALELLRHQTRPELLEAAVDTLNEANEVFLCGLRRMFPVATYLHYTLSQLAIRCHLVDGNGAMEQEQISWTNETSALIAITVSPYTSTTGEVVKAAKQRGCKIILMTDSELCPVADLADHVFVVREAEVRAFRSLNSTLCLAQTLCVALGYRRQAKIDLKHDTTPTETENQPTK